MAQTGIAVEGLRTFVRACDKAGPETKREVRGALREIGDFAREAWRSRYRPADAKSAAGLRTRVTQRAVRVEQSLRKTTGRHPDWGAWQMVQGRRALEDNSNHVERLMEHAVDRIADHFV